jgi:hypothetical protein
MLFDLRGRHRRRAVRVIYTGLAVLIGVGLVGFGVGGGFGGGGLLNAASENNGSGGASFSKEIKKYEKQTTRQPRDVAAWEGLTKSLLHEAGGEGYVTSAGVPTSKGRELLSRASRAWESYLALNPPSPSVELAKLMAQRVYPAEALNQPAAGVQALEIVVAAEPNSASWYSQLASYAYKAKNARVGDLASAKAVSLAPPTQRVRVKTELEAIKKSPEGQTLTTTTNGTTYTGKTNGSGGFVGTAVQSTPQPATKSPAKK